MPRSSGVHPCSIHTSVYHPSAAHNTRKATAESRPSPVHPGKASASSSTTSTNDVITEFLNNIKQEYYLTQNDRSTSGLILFAIKKVLGLNNVNSDTFSDKFVKQF